MSEKTIAFCIVFWLCVLLAGAARGLVDITPKPGLSTRPAQDTTEVVYPMKQRHIVFTGTDTVTIEPGPAEYSIDWDKVKTIQDVITILRELDIVVPAHSLQYERVKQFIRTSEVDVEAGP